MKAVFAISHEESGGHVLEVICQDRRLSLFFDDTGIEARPVQWVRSDSPVIADMVDGETDDPLDIASLMQWVTECEELNDDGL